MDGVQEVDLVNVRSYATTHQINAEGGRLLARQLFHHFFIPFQSSHVCHLAHLPTLVENGYPTTLESLGNVANQVAVDSSPNAVAILMLTCRLQL